MAKLLLRVLTLIEIKTVNNQPVDVAAKYGAYICKSWEKREKPSQIEQKVSV